MSDPVPYVLVLIGQERLALLGSTGRPVFSVSSARKFRSSPDGVCHAGSAGIGTAYYEVLPADSAIVAWIERAGDLPARAALNGKAKSGRKKAKST